MMYLKVYKKGVMVQDWREYKHDISAALTKISGNADKVINCINELSSKGEAILEGINPNSLESFKIELKKQV